MKHKALYLYLILFFLLCCSVTTTGQEKKQERFTLMGLGDSITEGADFFTCYCIRFGKNYLQPGISLILSVLVRVNVGSGRLIIVVSAVRMWSFWSRRSTASTGFIRQILYCSMPVITILRKRNLFPE